MNHDFQDIEIRIEKITVRNENESFYWMYYHIGDEVKIIGKSKERPTIVEYPVTFDS